MKSISFLSSPITRSRANESELFRPFDAFRFNFNVALLFITLSFSVCFPLRSLFQPQTGNRHNRKNHSNRPNGGDKFLKAFHGNQLR
jgi:hypothetical protein